MGSRAAYARSQFVCGCVRGGVKNKKGRGGCMSLCGGHVQFIPFNTHTTKLTSLKTNKILEKTFSWELKTCRYTKAYAHTQTHTQTHANTHKFICTCLSLLFPHPRWFDESHQTRRAGPPFSLTWTTGAICVMTPTATSGAYICVYGCVWVFLYF